MQTNLSHSSFKHINLTRRSRHALLCATLLTTLTGCASMKEWWNLGPEPSNYVGKGDSEKLLTDSTLRAVTPRVPGDEAGGGANLPGVAIPTTAPATATGPSTGTPASTTTLPDQLSVQDAILTGLENNINLRVQRYTVPKSRTAEEQALSAFDPTVSGSLQGGRNQVASTPGTTFPTTRPGNSGITDSISASASVTEFLPTGTTIQGQLTNSNNFYNESSSTTGASLTVTQSLLRGAGVDVNLASLREAELSTKVTQYQLRGVAESLVASIESAYWDLAFAERQVAIVQNALDVAQKQLDDTTQRVNVQRLAPSELPAAKAEVASRREDLINANASLETTRLKFLQLLTPARRDFWTRHVTLTTLPFIPTGTMDPVESHTQVALQFRPDLNEALLELKRGDLEIVRTKNGLLPRLDLFVTLGKSGFSQSFGDSINQSFNGADYQTILGVKGDWEPINRAARASYRASELSRDQLEDTLDNQRQLAQLDVRTQYIEVTRTRQQIDATRATREAREEDLNVQQGKLAAGSGTSLEVAIAQRDLLSAQLSEVQSVTNHLKALVQLYSLEGTLLLRRGLSAPGSTPVK